MNARLALFPAPVDHSGPMSPSDFSRFGRPGNRL